MYHLEGPCLVQSHTKPYLTTILASAFLMCSKNNFWIGIVYQKTRVTLESFDCAIGTWSILNYKFLGDKNRTASMIKHKTEHFNMTRTCTHQNVYPSFKREWQISLLCIMSIKYKRITLEIIGAKAFSFSNNFSASRNPSDSIDKNFTHFHLFNLLEN